MRRFLALSRTSHGLLDVAMPGFAALLWLGHFPALPVLAVALITAVAGYTAIYALNDLVGVRVDREKFSQAGPNPGYAVEASGLRYPLARGKLDMGRALAWFGVWYLIALAGAWWLNPLLVCVVLAAAALEIIYCLLLKTSWLRIFVSGLVKATGPVAAVLVVVPQPSLPWLALMIAWLMAWEIGGQNIPADWNDVKEDRRIGAKTIPVIFGPRRAARLVLIALILTVILSLLLPFMSPLPLGWPWQAAMLAAGIGLLLIPAIRLLHHQTSHHAARLFDRSSHYPVVLLVIVTVFVIADFPGSLNL